jgi:hypothetical protein
MDNKDIHELEEQRTIEGYFYREFGGMYYKTLGKVRINLIKSEVNFQFDLDPKLTIHTLPEYQIEYLRRSRNGIFEYRYNMSGDKMCFYNIEVSKCFLVRCFINEKDHKDFEYLKSLNLKGLPEENY